MGPDAGTLFVVATPIGHLEDVTLRALRVLREVALVAAEDTRRTRNLLQHYQIHTSVLSLHEHNEHQRVPQLLARLEAGESVAVVSDAGTPGIADPGATLVAAARAKGLRVEPVPGPSAVTAALSVSGLKADRFVFGGFPPSSGRKRQEWFDWVASHPSLPVLFFEAPHRIRRTLEDFGPKSGNRPILLGREVTKIHEEWREGLAHDLLASMNEDRGEFVGIVGPDTSSDSAGIPATDDEVAAMFGRITDMDGPGSRREAIRLTAERLKVTPRTVFAALERHKSVK